MKVKVEQRHIDAGEACDSLSCPIALAIKESHPGVPVEVRSDACFIGGRVYPLPAAAQNFVLRFDYEEVGEPFEFEIA